MLNQFLSKLAQWTHKSELANIVTDLISKCYNGLAILRYNVTDPERFSFENIANDKF